MISKTSQGLYIQCDVDNDINRSVWWCLCSKVEILQSHILVVFWLISCVFQDDSIFRSMFYFILFEVVGWSWFLVRCASDTAQFFRQEIFSARSPFDKLSVGKMSVRPNVFRQDVFQQSVFRQNVRPCFLLCVSFSLNIQQNKSTVNWNVEWLFSKC